MYQATSFKISKVVETYVQIHIQDMLHMYKKIKRKLQQRKF